VVTTWREREANVADGKTAAGSSEQQASRAPGRLEVVEAFVNTLDIEAGSDELRTPGALSRWLADRELIPAAASVTVTSADLERALRMREGLRAVLRAHAAGQPDQTGRAADLGEIAAGLPAGLAVQADGQVRTVPHGDGAAAGLAAILLVAAEAATAGTWPRLKVCSADDCQWAFYDRSPARSGHWCSMAVCGSRAKSRAYRRRIRT
jgi:predicted RNA-binding Zn ribbon-like protein